MRIFAVKLSLKGKSNKDDVYAIIIKWLKSSEQWKEVGEKFAQSDKKEEICINVGDCIIETFCGEDKDIKYFAFRFTHKYYGRIWDTDVIYEEGKFGKRLIIYVNCTGDITHFSKAPASRSDIIQLFIQDEILSKDGIFPIQNKPILAEDSKLNLIANIMNRKQRLDLPLVYVSKIFDRCGFEVDVENLAKRLAGFAYVIAEEESDFSFRLKQLTDGKNPYNGYIKIYFPNGDTNNVNSKGTVEDNIINDIVHSVTAQVDTDYSSWERLYAERKSIEAKSNSELLEDCMKDYDSLERKLKEKEEKISALMEENKKLKNKYDSIQEAFNTNGIMEKLITKSAVDEFFNGEQNDLLITILKKELNHCDKDTRKYELISSILDKNNYIGNGEEKFEEIKKILGGEALNKQDISKLEKLGLKLMSSNKHYKFVYMNNDRYTFIVSKTPSDDRGGQNKASNIKNRLSVYQ